jgi:ABC-2 type transport system ATP-binding protein
MSLAIETSGLQYKAGRGRRAFEVSRLNMHVPKGAVYGFLGPNGSGKTTTIRLLLGMLEPEGGTITILGEDMPANYPSVLGRTGYVPERPHLYQSLTVSETIAFHRAFYPTWDQKWADDLIREFDLDPDRKLSALSKGESGKVMMLLALAQKPELLVLDEPTDGLDPVVRRDILAAVLNYVTDVQATVLISSHLVHELERFCDWVGLMDHGQLIAEVPMQDFKSGIKKLRVSSMPSELINPPFTVLSRERTNGIVEQLLVRGWVPNMQDYFVGHGATVREVIDLDLEDGFVEMLRAARTSR